MKVALVLISTAIVAISVGPSIFSSLWGRKWRRTAAVAGAGIVVFYSVWILYLARTLPSETVANNWNIAWAALDSFEGLAALFSAVLLHKHSKYAVVTTTAFSTSLCIDALFAITTASPGMPLTVAILQAVLIELPVATLAAVLALKLLNTGASAPSTPPGPPGPATGGT
ncbi:hypothetical protein IV500_01100 [Paeniglutamicibacter antarcticus]|uniref:Uncharacterized protein n=1 Tax=Arthrobacter terrae TaxID=2935737 RepID=A0A931CM87_9MICC|nr:hypothetical protein [Arthrobacter terrae]MBG0738034.1 hypothetical protein [Arthrobacter terrae]